MLNFNFLGIQVVLRLFWKSSNYLGHRLVFLIRGKIAGKLQKNYRNAEKMVLSGDWATRLV